MNDYIFCVKDEGGYNATSYTAEAWLWVGCDGYPPELLLIATEHGGSNPAAILKELKRTLRIIEKVKEAPNA